MRPPEPTGGKIATIKPLRAYVADIAWNKKPATTPTKAIAR